MNQNSISKNYYHITPFQNTKDILSNGLIANTEGEIYVFQNGIVRYNNVNNLVSDCIAYNQLFLEEYAIFEINSKGVFGTIRIDNIGEFSSKIQWVIRQERIGKEYLKFLGFKKTGFKSWISGI